MKLTAKIIIFFLCQFSVNAEQEKAYSLGIIRPPEKGQINFEKRKDAIAKLRLNKPSPKVTNLNEPFMDIGVHIHADDSISIYKPYESLVHKPKDDNIRIKAEDVKTQIENVPRFSKPAVTVLITSDLPLVKSFSVHELMNEIYLPITEIYYLQNNAIKRDSGS